LFEAAWVEGLDVNEPATVVWAAGRAGLDPEVLMMELAGPGPAEGVRTALAEFERLQCPGVPTVVVDGQRFFGKDRSIGSPISAAQEAEHCVIEPS
jgi:2-hydroxychromene-2-carboxylate isomerase